MFTEAFRDSKQADSSLRNEFFRVLDIVDQRILDISEKQLLGQLRSTNNPYWKHDLSLIKNIAAKYDITTSELDMEWENYVRKQTLLLSTIPFFEQSGLSEIYFGSGSMHALVPGICIVRLTWNDIEQKIDILISPESPIHEDDYWSFPKEMEPQVMNIRTSLENLFLRI